MHSNCICSAWQPSAGDRPMYDGPDLPSTDLPEDHLAPEPQPLPLDVTRLCKIEGYEHVGYHLNGQYSSTYLILYKYNNVDRHLTEWNHKFQSVYKF